MARDKFSSETKNTMSAEEEKKLEANDKTFTNTECDFGEDIDSFKSITPDRKFTVRGWSPSSDNKKIEEYLRKAKMNKSDYFYKVFSDMIDKPLYIILRLIEMGEYFPKSMRTSKLTFLDSGRAIFSLEPLTKVVEMVLAAEFNDCLRKEYEENGDPMQMAYEPKRGTTSCNAVTFTLCDISLSVTGKPVAQTFADLVKAFNMANRTVMLERIHKIAGAGNICKSRFDNRVYTYDGEKRGQGFNRGVDPGAPVSVLLFKLFMNTDRALSALNPNLLWPSLYSDDRSPLFEADEYINGNAQLAWDSSKEWSDQCGCEYHTEATDKKRHTYLAYCTKNMAIINEFGQLLLGDVPFEFIEEIRELGLNISTDRSVEKAKAMVDRWGYYFRPENARLKSIAYRMQAVKNDYPPFFMRQMVMSNFCGVLCFSSCLYWVRSLKWELDNVRFYYIMAVSSILKLNAQEIVGSAICKLMSVKEGNSRYHKLLKIVGLPTIKDMAMTDAVATIRQVVLIKPEFFKDTGRVIVPNRQHNLVSRFFVVEPVRRSTRKRQRTDRMGVAVSAVQIADRHEKVIAANLPTELSDIVVKTGAIIGPIWRLACEKVKQEKIMQEYTTHKYEQLYEIAKCFNSKNGKKDVCYLRSFEEYRTLCAKEMGILEIQQRRLGFNTPTKRLELNKFCPIVPPVWDTNKGPKKLFFSCRRPLPNVGETPIFDSFGKSFKCVVCGYNILPKIENDKEVYDFISCKKCPNKAHTECVVNSFIPKKAFWCSKIERHLGKGGVQIDGVNVYNIRTEPPPRRQQMCLICGDHIKIQTEHDFTCTRKCGFFAHADCVNVHSKVLGIVVPRQCDFMCRNIEYQIRIEEVEKCRSGLGNEIRKLKKILRNRGYVYSEKYIKKRKRWVNDEIQCVSCKRWYGTNELNHTALYCNSADGVPINESNDSYPFAHLKRFKHMTRLTP